MRKTTNILLYGLFLLLMLLTSAQESHGALLLAMYQKMNMLMDKVSISDSIGAENGNPSSMIRYGKWCIRNGRKQKGIQYLEKVAALGNDTAKCCLAELYYFRDNKEFHNPQKALKIIHDIKIKEGDFLRALMYYDGIGVERDYGKAFELLSSIPETSFFYSLSLYYLSKCYRYGRGVNANIETANKLILHAHNLVSYVLKATYLEEIKPNLYIKITKIKAPTEEQEQGVPTFGLR
ncbi:MAG: tetratricopeptide repeat protein [Muribaculaceae bacterium]